MKNSLNEALVKAEEVETFGSNVGEYDDQLVKYDTLSKSFYTVIKISDSEFIPVSIRYSDGLIRFTYSNNPSVSKMLRLPIIYRRDSVRKSFAYISNILYVIQIILKRFHPRLKQLMFATYEKYADRMLMFLFRSPEFKRTMIRYRFSNFQYRKDVENKVMLYYFIKTNKKGA